MALVVTLVMLALITVMAVAFLALARRETAAVDTLGSTTDAEIMAETALERAKAQILAHIAAGRAAGVTNPSGPDLMVSLAGQNPIFLTNFLDNGAIDAADWPLIDPFVSQQFDPSAPVFVSVLQGTTRRIDDRRFLDLNRNGYFDETGWVPATLDSVVAGRYEPAPDGAGGFITNFVVGDPHWIGVPRLPGQPHDRNNRFLGRYAFLVVPAGRALDVNWTHNNALSRNVASNQPSGYFRNQGVGGFEINLGAFLIDLNTNEWGNLSPRYPAQTGYDFNPFTPVAGGRSFIDALEIIRHRYAGSGNNLSNAAWWLGGTVGAEFQNDFVDTYCNGPLAALGASLNAVPGSEAGVFRDDPVQPWAGSDAPTHFFSLHDFFDTAKLPGPPPPAPGFREGMRVASQQGNSYDRYTFYRMVAQLGTDGAPEDEDAKVNINYCNLRPFRAEGMVPWNDGQVQSQFGRPGSEVFFTNVVNRLLRQEFGIQLGPGTNGIPIFRLGSTFSTNGPLYSSRIHQILKLAANIYDAAKDRTGETTPYLPTVFRPRFREVGGVIYIYDYEEDTGEYFANSSTWYDLDGSGSRPSGTWGRFEFAYDIPFIIGARQGFPNFNEFTMASSATMVRKVKMIKTSTNDVPPSGAQMQLIMTVNNLFGLEYWNPNLYYAGGAFAYPSELELRLSLANQTRLTNDLPNGSWTSSASTNRVVQFLPGIWTTNTFSIALDATNTLIRPSSHFASTNGFAGLTNAPSYDSSVMGDRVRWGLSVTNRLLSFLFDKGRGNRIVDAFSSARLGAHLDVDAHRRLKYDLVNQIADIWSPNPSGARTVGINKQVSFSQTYNATLDPIWRNFSPGIPNVNYAVTNFNAFMTTTTHPELEAVVPFTPTRRIDLVAHWEVNDPLVHHRAEELMDVGGRIGETNAYSNLSSMPSLTFTGTKPLQNTTLGKINGRYKPWGGPPDNPDANANLPNVWDAGATNIDAWRFPDHKLPNPGWLGRVHRGTPWQSIYLKSEPVNDNVWKNQTGGAYSFFTSPTNDWRLLDIFTTAIHPNATRGRLSINQTNLAAWSAVLSGVTVSTAEEIDDGGLQVAIPKDTIIEPAALDLPISMIVSNINEARAVRPGRVFQSMGELLSVPALTVKSPFLDEPILPGSTVGLFNRPNESRLRDEDYERIPQQILGLLKVGEPRYVVYAWGQSLKPAGNVPGIGLGIDPATQVVRNYQVTGESATRAVVRVDYDTNGRPHAVVESFNIIPLE